MALKQADHSAAAAAAAYAAAAADAMLPDVSSPVPYSGLQAPMVHGAPQVLPGAEAVFCIGDPCSATLPDHLPPTIHAQGQAQQLEAAGGHDGHPAGPDQGMMVEGSWGHGMGAPPPPAPTDGG